MFLIYVASIILIVPQLLIYLLGLEYYFGRARQSAAVPASEWDDLFPKLFSNYTCSTDHAGQFDRFMRSFK